VCVCVYCTGVSGEKLVEGHGSFHSATCIDERCAAKYTQEEIGSGLCVVVVIVCVYVVVCVFMLLLCLFL